MLTREMADTPTASDEPDMLNSIVVKTVEFCARHAWAVLAVSAALGIASAVYAVNHFEITTDINKLISPDLPWRQREIAFMNEFPRREIQVVVDAPTPELVDEATAKLAERLDGRRDVLPSIRQPESGPFFRRNGLLFLPTDQVEKTTQGLAEAEPLLDTLSSDPSLRGVLFALSYAISGVKQGKLKLDDLTRPATMAADTLDDVLADRPASFSWRVLAQGKPAELRDLRRFIEAEPKLDFTALEPGKVATDAIRKAAVDLKLADDYRARVRLTGMIPIDDDEFATLQEGAGLNAVVSTLAVLLILWLALRSTKIIVAVVISLVIGLAATAALGLLMVGAFNLISVAFAVLCVGLGVDFGLQFSVRHRAERHDVNELREALQRTAQKAGGPLALAAAATTIGFFSFLPTAYRGLSELGLIAGCGMLIAFVGSITTLPALLRLLNPPGEPHEMGFKVLAPVDEFLERRRVPVIVGTLALVVLASPLLLYLPFDFNPLNLRSAKVESVATFLDLRKDPQTGANSVEIMKPSVKDADATAERVRKLPEVSQAITISNFVPDDQDKKIEMINRAAKALDEALYPKELDQPPTDEDNIEALNGTAGDLAKIAGDDKGPGGTAARRLADLLTRLAKADPSKRQKADAAFVPPLKTALDNLRQELKPEKIAVQTIPSEVSSDWLAKDGHARVEVLPNGDPNDNEILRHFATAVLKVEADATGAAVSFLESGDTVVHAFIEAGAFALAAIAVLLFFTLRRISDVLLTLVPLVLAGVVTLELCVVFGLPLNFANIIALPLLLGVGVAFKIYYIMAWRSGKTRLLQSTLTRAVIFSAMTTATAFGSLWLSNHPGTSSMGKLMALSLVCTLAAAVLFQPVLMGPPRLNGQ